MSAAAKEKPAWAQSEQTLVAEFLSRFVRDHSRQWTVYPETSDWDLLLVHRDGFQIGLEAKLSFNAKVIDQALGDQHGNWRGFDGPDFRGVIVPMVGRQHHLARICKAIGIGIVTLREEENGTSYGLNLPSRADDSSWVNWGPVVRCPLPDYVPDVVAGRPAPVKLTDWKVKAIQLSIILDRRGWVERADMRAIGISPSRWTDHYNGFLRNAGSGQYERCKATPDYRSQHPENYAEIEADVKDWGRKLDPFKQNCPEWLLAPANTLEHQS